MKIRLLHLRQPHPIVSARCCQHMKGASQLKRFLQGAAKTFFIVYNKKFLQTYRNPRYH